MGQQPNEQVSPFVTQVDITAGSDGNSAGMAGGGEQARLLQEILSSLDRQNSLLEELLGQSSAVQKQRQTELENWKQSYPQLQRKCRRAAETLSKVQAQFLERVADEVHDSSDDLMDGDFLFGEFVDRFGPRMAHLNGVLQVLNQLGGPINSNQSS